MKQLKSEVLSADPHGVATGSASSWAPAGDSSPAQPSAKSVMNPKLLVLVSSGGGRLHVRCTETARVSDSSRMFADVRQQALADQATELLFDASAIKERLSVVGRLQMAMAFVSHLRGFRVAGVISEVTIDPGRLGETMARNRGANLKVFTRLPEALAWLGWDVRS